MKKKIFLALSGGVDSAVSAKILKDEGYDVIGVFMKNWSGDEYGIQSDCPWEKDQQDAESVCRHIRIDFMSVNFEREYRDRVVKYFFNEYEKGNTPNPDVMCNKEIKFKLFFEKAKEMGFDAIATGHYAKNFFDKEKNEYFLLRSKDLNKDQTYFPIGSLTKQEVRELAKKFNLPNANKPDSQGICFIGEINVLKYLQSKLPKKIGEIIDIDTNKFVGYHNGTYFYTIGQREGLGIGGQTIPYYVVRKDIKNNILFVGHGVNHPAMFSKTVQLENINFINPSEHLKFQQSNKSKYLASIRYRQEPQPGTLIKTNENNIIFHFDEPQRAIATGQSLVIYNEKICLGGGVISSIF